MFVNLLHAFTTKECGNLAFHVGDKEQNVQNNHELLAKELGYDKSSLVHMKQIHSDIVHVISNEEFDTPPVCDALVTDKPNIPLMVMVADCSPVLFYDCEKNVIAVAHAGRQGAFKNIVKNVIETMKSRFGSEPKNIHVSIGASIGKCCYEVGEEIYDEAKTLGLEHALEQAKNSFYLDVSVILKEQLLGCGIKEEHLDISDDCTCCKTDTYYSYRAQRETGRFAGVLMLKG